MKLYRNKLFISVIIPCYNQGHFLDIAIQSILRQDYSNFEIIIINDGSTDPNTINIVNQLKNKKLPYIKIYSIKNKGLAGARNFGLDKARGELIQFLDADDQLLPDKWNKQVDFFKKNPNSYINYTKFIFQKNKKIIKPFPESTKINDSIRDFLFRWESTLTIPPHCFLFKKKCFQEHRFNTEFKACEDWVLWSELALSGFKFFNIDFIGCVYHLHDTNMTSKRDQLFYNNILTTSYLRNKINDSKLKTEFDQKSIERLKYIFYEYFQEDFLENNPDKEELEKIKSSKFFKLWQSYNYFLRKVGIKHNALN